MRMLLMCDLLRSIWNERPKSVSFAAYGNEGGLGVPLSALTGSGTVVSMMFCGLRSPWMILL